MEQVKGLLFEYVALEKKRSKLLRISIWVGIALFLFMFGTFMYFITQPAPATIITLRQMQDMQKNMQLQQKLLLMEREDVTLARTQINEMLKRLYKQDSIRITKH